MQRFRSILFVVVWMAVSAVIGIVCLFLWPFPFRTRFSIVMLWNRFVIWWARICCGIEYRVIDERSETAGPFVVLSNHQSAWETIFLQNYFAPVCTVLKRELLRIPFFGWGLALLRPVPIDRNVPLKALKRVKALGVSRLAEGNNVLVFPEGTRMPSGEVGRYARSGADIACAAGVPVVPVAHNAGRCWPKKGILKYPGMITLVIGEPISTVGRSSKRVTAEVKDWIEARTSLLDDATPVTKPDLISNTYINL